MNTATTIYCFSLFCVRLYRIIGYTCQRCTQHSGHLKRHVCTPPPPQFSAENESDYTVLHWLTRNAGPRWAGWGWLLQYFVEVSQNFVKEDVVLIGEGLVLLYWHKHEMSIHQDRLRHKFCWTSLLDRTYWALRLNAKSQLRSTCLLRSAPCIWPCGNGNTPLWT